MIRRGFWLVVGAACGIMGYRRVVALFTRGGRPPAWRAPAPHPPWPPRSPSPRSPLAPRRRLVRETIRFTRDVREGMDLYMVRHPRQAGPTLDADIDENVKDDR